MVIFSNTKQKISLFKIEEVERYANLKFPQQYKEHLLKYNGGQCIPNIFTCIENGKIGGSSIEWFLAIDTKFNNLKEYIETYKIEEKRMPTYILPIANDGLGNSICISTSGIDEGYIYFWDHEQEVDYSVSDDSDYSNLFLIAKSFNEFLNGLKDSNFIDTLNN
jgi:SMI1-KNR4 cell-wall